MAVALDISRALRNPGQRFPYQHEEHLAPQDILGETVAFDPVQMTGHFALEEGQLHLEGRLTTVAHAACAKCLEPADYEVDVPFYEIFIRPQDLMEESGDDTDPLDRLAYDGPQLAVDQLALTLTLLDLPMRFLCKETCQGLDNIVSFQRETHADQEDLPEQHPFSALQQLLNKEQEV